MIPVTLTTTSGTNKSMSFPDRKSVENFIENMANKLTIGTVVNIDAPLIGIHSGWIQGRAPAIPF